MPALIADGPALLAVRPEFLTLVRSDAADAPMVHRVIDYGTHLMVDIELTDGARLKAMTPPSEEWRAGMRLALGPREISIYRDDVVAYRASLDAPVGVAANG